ncbi:MAG: DMT family transporter [Actinomycetota bacterium]|jgi:drug/metabolite transporter (DMT)-like permease|nr:DMT family transporter [Actinomycetota bacterium]
MSRAIPLAVAAGLFTAASTTCQRVGALRAPDDGHIDPGLLLRLIRQPIWVLGGVSMTLGFVLQAIALHFGSLAMVQPILAAELLFVFAYLAIANPHLVRRRDGLSALAMAVGLGAVLFTADPSGGRAQAPAGRWALAGFAGFLVVGALVLAARGSTDHAASAARRAALLGAAAGVCWGLLAGVIKQLGAIATGGVVDIFTSWPVYALVLAGLASMTLATNALRAGPLAASQPGFTIVDPLIAAVVGVLLFGEHLQTSAGDVLIEAAALVVLGAGAWGLSRSALVAGTPATSDSSTATA